MPKDFSDLMIAGMSKESVGLKCVQIKWWLSTGCPQLDYAIRPGHPPEKQGLPNGKWTELLGPEGSGKTAWALRVAASIQQIGGHVIYLAAESGTFEEYIALNRVSMDPEYFTPGHPFSLESCVQAIENIVVEYHDQERPILIIVDSISGLEAADYTLDAQSFKKSTPQAAGAKAMHRFCRRGQSFYLQGAPIWGIVIRHETGSPRAFDFGIHTTHGKALDYYTWVRIKCSKKAFDDKYGGKEMGAFLSAQVVKSKVGPNYGSASAPFYASHGWDPGTEQLHYLLDCKAFPEPSSGRFTFNGTNYTRYQLRDMYYNDASVKATVDSMVQTCLANGGKLL